MLVEEKLASPEAVDAALSHQKALRSRRFGEYLTDNQIVSPEQLAAALKHQRSQPIQKLGETLVELGYLTESELDEALAIEARDRSVPLGQILADMGVVEAEVVNAVIARKLGIPYISLKTFRIPPEVLKRIPAAVAQRFQTLPVAESDNALAVAIENPMDMAKLEELRFVVGSKLLPVMASGEDIRAALERAYGDARAAAPAEVRKRIDVGIGELTHRLAAETADAAIDETQSLEQDNTLVQLVNKMIIDAAEQKASDIHIEANPGGKDMRVRFRKDGALVTYLDLPAKFRKAVVSRLKIMAQLDITERRKPQDGKIEFRRFGPLDVDLRIATIPTTGGLEDIVMRVLAAATPVALDALGFDAAQLEALKRLISRPHGLFLVCGPTGSGKTTTLHSLLRELNTADLKIWTAEDPIEIVAGRPAPGAGQPQDRLDLRRGDAQLHARRPRRDHGGRDARRRDRQDRHRGLAHRPPGVLHAAHQQRGGKRGAPARPRHGPVQFRRRPAWRARAAPGAQTVPRLQGGVRPERAGARRARRRIARTGHPSTCSTAPRDARAAIAPATRAAWRCTSCWWPMPRSSA